MDLPDGGIIDQVLGGGKKINWAMGIFLVLLLVGIGLLFGVYGQEEGSGAATGMYRAGVPITVIGSIGLFVSVALYYYYKVLPDTIYKTNNDEYLPLPALRKPLSS